MDKYIVTSVEEVLYEVIADSKEEAKEIFEGGGGDFIGYSELEERAIKVELYDATR